MTTHALDDVTILGMQVCAARNDPSVSGAAFVELVSRLVRQAVSEYAAASSSEPGAVLISAASDEAEKINTADGEPGDEPEPAPARTTAAAAPRGRRGRNLSYDDRTRIRTRYQAELEVQRARGFSRLPRGFVAGLAAQYGVSDVTIISIGRNTDSFRE